MPRYIRPSYVKVQCDGRKEDIACGPRSRTGRMQVEVLIRKDGCIHNLLDVIVCPDYDGLHSSVVVRVRMPGQEQQSFRCMVDQ